MSEVKLGSVSKILELFRAAEMNERELFRIVEMNEMILSGDGMLSFRCRRADDAGVWNGHS